MRAVLVDLLSPHWTVTTASGGAEALKVLEDLQPVAVLSDLIMPDIDGLALCDRIRSNRRLAHLPVMLLSANGTGEVQASALWTVDEFMGKPFHEAELIVRLKKLIARSAGIALGAPPTSPLPSSGSTTSPAQLRALRRRIDEAIHRSLGDALYTVDDLARDLAVSPRQLRRRLLELGPLGPKAYIREVRLKAAHEMLEVGAFGSVAEVAAAVGMAPAYFSRTYRAWAGAPPSQALG